MPAKIGLFVFVRASLPDKVQSWSMQVVKDVESDQPVAHLLPQTCSLSLMSLSYTLLLSFA